MKPRDVLTAAAGIGFLTVVGYVYGWCAGKVLCRLPGWH